ncbi:hypothetical protein QQP08_004673 [Theobroma cacao]|nr:hypothetical protein QQP08_004673 [Theobroma cacao]
MALPNSLFFSSCSSPVGLRRSGISDSHSAPHFSSIESSIIRKNFSRCGIITNFSAKKNIVYAANESPNSVSSTSLLRVQGIKCIMAKVERFMSLMLFFRHDETDQDADYIPMPMVLIDQDSDSEATIVQLSFGDRLGALVDTMRALKDLGLDVAKGTVLTEGSVTQTKFFITRLDTGRKVEDPDMLERIRLTIINNLLKYHPESSEQLAMGEAFGVKAPEKKDWDLKNFKSKSIYLLMQLDIDIATRIHVKEDGPKRSLLCIETADRPGLLVEIIKIITDVNIDVESAEIDTEGLVAKDKFHVSYRGAALNNSLSQVLVNCLRYYLRRPETDIDSY